MTKLRRLLALSWMVAIIAACGGGGGTGGVSTPSTSGTTISYSTTSAVTNQSTLLSPTVSGAPGGVKSFTISSGVLPGGMVLNGATGEISGTPTALGSYPVTIALTVSGATGSVSTDITLQVVNPAITGTLSYSSPNLIRGSASTINPSVSGVPSGTSYAATNLPADLIIDVATGVISGIPTSAGTFDITVTATATNSSGSLQAHVIGSISDPAIGTLGATITYSDMNPVTHSGGNSTPSPVTISPTLSGIPNGASPNFTLASGSLPTGISLNTSTGVISGTTSVAPGDYNFAVSLSINGYSGSDISNSVTITVSNPANYIDWSQVTASTPFFPILTTANANGAKMVSIGSDLYVVKTNASSVGTYTYKSSDNGATWTLINTDTSMNFSNFALTSNGNNLVMLGGVSSNGMMTTTYNSKVITLDVSTATPTTAWSLGATPPFSQLQEHSVVKQGNSYYVLGGYTGSGFSNSVYTSTDAQTWSAVTLITPFSARSMHCAFSDGANLYVYGGESSSGGANAVLNKDLLISADLGATWTQVIADVGTTGTLYPTCGYVNGNIVIAMGGSLSTGYTATIFTNTVRSSSDGGATWISTPTVPAAYTNSSYYSAAFTVFNNALYVTLGEDRNMVYGSVWKISP